MGIEIGRLYRVTGTYNHGLIAKVERKGMTGTDWWVVSYRPSTGFTGIHKADDLAEIPIEWSFDRDLRLGLVAVAVQRSRHRHTFEDGLAAFAAKLNRHEDIKVMWWHDHYVFVQVVDRRLDYPEQLRALVSFDLTTGTWASPDSGNRYVFARRGWRAFLERLTGGPVPLYS